MTLPRPLVLPAVVAGMVLTLPLLGLITGVPWTRFGSLIAAPATTSALWLSLWTSALSAIGCILLGTPLGWLFARGRFRGQGALRALVLTPLVLPPVVAGVALLAAFGRTGLIGAPLRAAFGISLPYTSMAVVLAHIFVGLPFFVLGAEAAFRSLPPRVDQVAHTLGADPWTMFRRVALPLAAPGLAAATLLAWARSLGEFGATITFAGNYPTTTRTLPLEVYTQLHQDPEAAIAVSMLLFGICVLTLIALRERWWGALR